MSAAGIDSILVYECGHRDVHTVPSDEVQVLRIGDGGFVIACPCGPEPLEAADHRPHESTDHLANVYYDDPTPEDWLALESVADGWYDCEPHAPVDDEDFSGTYAQRREDFKGKMENAADYDRDGFDSRRNDPENRASRKVACPDCGASAGAPCQRPSGHTVQQVHADRKGAARDAGHLEDGESPEAGEQASLDEGWS